eukprot:gene32486-17730_t
MRQRAIVRGGTGRARVRYGGRRWRQGITALAVGRKDVCGNFNRAPTHPDSKGDTNLHIQRGHRARGASKCKEAGIPEVPLEQRVMPVRENAPPPSPSSLLHSHSTPPNIPSHSVANTSAASSSRQLGASGASSSPQPGADPMDVDEGPLSNNRAHGQGAVAEAWTNGEGGSLALTLRLSRSE